MRHPLLLAAALAGTEIFGGHALFALAMVGVAGSGLEGFATLLGAALGYLSFQGFLEGLRYIAGGHDDLRRSHGPV